MSKHKRGPLPVLPQGRRQRGNMIALVAAIGAGLLVALLLFALAYTRLLGGNQEQKTAIEAASLAAAKDLGSIVIKDDYFGWVSLSDYAPTGAMTKAPDGLYQPVYGINTILATIRLDMILADQISAATGSPASMATFSNLANLDYAAAMTSKDKLTTVLQNSLLPGGDPQAKDIQGNLLVPYTSAENAYKANAIRQTGGSQYVNGSLKLTLGCLQNGSETTVSIPTPNSKAALGGQQTQNGKYLSYTNYQYNGKDFVFTAAGSGLKLVDASKFQTALGLPYFIPSIVRAEADQKFFENGDTTKPARIIHALACAQPACVPDPRPAPGMFISDSPDGQIPSVINRPADWLTDSRLNGGPKPATIQTSKGGDYYGPGSTGTLVSDSSLGGSPQPATGIAAAVYDWLRRGGHKVNIDSVIAMLNGAGLPGGKFQPNQMYKWIIDQNGNVFVTVGADSKEPYIALAENQIYMACGDALQEISATSPTGKKAPWSLYMKDQSRRWGPVYGGQHAGEPMPTAGTVLACHPTDTWVACLPSALPDNAIAMHGDSGTGKLGDLGVMGSGAEHDSGGATATTALPVQQLDDWAEPGKTSLAFPYTSGSPAPGLMPPQYLLNGCTSLIRWRIEEISSSSGSEGEDAGGGKKQDTSNNRELLSHQTHINDPPTRDGKRARRTWLFRCQWVETIGNAGSFTSVRSK